MKPEMIVENGEVVYTKLGKDLQDTWTACPDSVPPEDIVPVSVLSQGIAVPIASPAKPIWSKE